MADTTEAAGDADPARFDVPVFQEGETVEVLVLMPSFNLTRYRVIWRARDEFGYLDHGHISSHESLRSAKSKRNLVAAWLAERAVHSDTSDIRQEQTL